MSEEIVLLNGARTPFGSFGGSLKGHSSIELGVLAARAALENAGVSAEDVDETIFGNVIQSEANAIYLARHIGLKTGVPKDRPALTVNRLCGSGMEALVSGARTILTSGANVILTGGSESMSQAPHIDRQSRWGQKMGPVTMEDSLLAGLTDNFAGAPMGITAENLAGDYKISRAEQDEFAALSQTRAEEATEAGRLAEEITPVVWQDRKGREIRFDKDEYIKGKAGTEGLAKLRPAFKKEDGTVTAGNASGINDGASSIVIARRSWADQKGLSYDAILRGFASAGCDPTRMGIGPAVAIPRALNMAGLSLEDMGLVEVNEAFAAQYLAVEKELGLKREICNVNGGAIAIGHPLGASGSRVTLTLMKEMKRRDVRYGTASLCIGGGQGIAVVLEKV